MVGFIIMYKSTINTKYQIVLPKELRKLVSGIIPGNTVIITINDDNSLMISPQDSKIMWADRVKDTAENIYGNDPDQYIQNLRKKWGQRKLPNVK